MTTVISALDLARGAANQVAAADKALEALATGVGLSPMPKVVTDARRGLKTTLERLRKLQANLEEARQHERPPAPQGYVYLDEWVRAWQAWEARGGEGGPNWRETMPAARFRQVSQWPSTDVDPDDRDFFWFVRLWDVDDTTAYARIDTAGFPAEEDFAGYTSFYREDELSRIYANVFGRGV